MGSMSANRRVLENLQQQSVIKKYLYQQIANLFRLSLQIVAMSLIYYMPNYTDIERDPECEMNAHKANTWSVWIVCGAMLCCSLGWILTYLYKRARNTSTIEMFEFIGKSTILLVIV